MTKMTDFNFDTYLPERKIIVRDTAQLPSRERLEKIASWRETYGAGHNVMLPAEEAGALARFALAAHEQEPVAVVELSDYVTAAQLSGDEPRRKAVKELYEGALVVGQNLFASPAPVPAVPNDIPAGLAGTIVSLCAYNVRDKELAQKIWNACRAAMLNGGKSERDKVRAAHAEWSQKTFGNVGPVGPLKHLAKEAIEAADAPDDLSEWADMQFLLWDAQRRAGITDEQINQAMLEKLAVNKAREWPEPKDGEPRLHIQSAPKV